MGRAPWSRHAWSYLSRKCPASRREVAIMSMPTPASREWSKDKNQIEAAQTHEFRPPPAFVMFDGDGFSENPLKQHDGTDGMAISQSLTLSALLDRHQVQLHTSMEVADMSRGRGVSPPQRLPPRSLNSAECARDVIAQRSDRDQYGPGAQTGHARLETSRAARKVAENTNGEFLPETLTKCSTSTAVAK